jgi:hypothetical protein
LADTIRIQFRDRAIAIMETTSVLSTNLEKTFRRDINNVMALRAILLPTEGLDKCTHDARRLDWPDPSYYQRMSAF